MKRINIENIHLLIGENQPGSNSELFEFSIDNMATADEQYSFSFSYSNNTTGTKYSGYFQLVREIINHTYALGKVSNSCKLNTTLWANGNPFATILKDTMIPMEVIKQYELLYLFIRSYIREVIG
jgi:hypothetical protein